MECPLTFRLAQSGDFDAVVKLSEGIYDGHDYLPFTFHKWLQRDNFVVLLAYSGDKLVGLVACFVVDEGRTFIRRAERILAELRGQGLVRQLREFARQYVREHFHSIERERSVVGFDKVSSRDQTELLEYDVVSYQVIEPSFSQAIVSMNKSNTRELCLCSTEYFSDVILTQPARGKLFPKNVVVINSCPFEPNPSNVDEMLQECSEILVEKCGDGVLPRSISIGTFSTRVKCVHWRVSVYTEDPVLFKVHLFYQFKRACELIRGDFIFVSFQDKSWTKFTRKAMEEQLQLKECDADYSDKTMKLYERDLTRY